MGLSRFLKVDRLESTGWPCMITITRIIGASGDSTMAERLHDLAHHGRVEYLTIATDDMARRRFRGRTDRGTDVAIALARPDRLGDGAVLFLSENRAIVVRALERKWLKVVPRDLEAALAAGFFAGNQHWRVQFAGGTMLVALEGSADDYTSQLEELTRGGRIEVAVDE